MIGILVGLTETAFAVEVRTWHGRGSWTTDPENKRLWETWLASEMWVNAPLLFAGGMTLVLSVILAFAMRARAA